ncbi:hypothetical protein EDE12_11869 [Methylosinus sp. sav-2]|jgi:hypothetical protein|nr:MULTISPECIES: hypothetical protein [unclassified Methylosinus]TDX60833.1 hypothetical protein EDE12_11869 [Methylosinus sp. sav-2]
MDLFVVLVSIGCGFWAGYTFREHISRRRRMRWQAEQRLGARAFYSAVF